MGVAGMAVVAEAAALNHLLPICLNSATAKASERAERPGLGPFSRQGRAAPSKGRIRVLLPRPLATSDGPSLRR